MEAAMISVGSMGGAVPAVPATPAPGGGGAARPSLGNIFQRPGGR